MIDETVEQQRPPTRAQQRESTRRAVVDATLECLVEDGYATLTTRRIAERAGVAQSTLMHHFETREALLVEAVGDLALRLASEALDEINFEELHSPQHREAVLDRTWREFTSPQALAAAQLWVAAWSEPELATAVHDLESRINSILGGAAAALFPDLVEDARFPGLVGAAIALIRGLVFEIPISGREVVEARWATIKPLLLEAAGRLLD